MTQEERIEYLVSEVNRLNNFIAERDQKIEMLLDMSKPRLTNEQKRLGFEIMKLADENKTLNRKIEMLYEEKASLMDEVRSLKSRLDAVSPMPNSIYMLPGMAIRRKGKLPEK